MNRQPHFEAPPEPQEELLNIDRGRYFADEFGNTAAEQGAHEPLGARLDRERPDIEVPDTAPEPLPLRHFRIDDPGHWNVIATARSGHEEELIAALAKLGDVHDSPFPGVVLVTADDIDTFADALLQVIADDPAAAHAFARVLPAQHTFHFESLADLELITRDLVDDWRDDLDGATFHVRCHRRGRVNDLDPVEEADFLGDAILRLLDERGTRGHVTFDDPDFVVDIETLNDEAAISMWTRDDLRAFPFLRIE